MDENFTEDRLTNLENTIRRLDTQAQTMATTSMDANPDEGARALELSLLGEKLPAEKAFEWGLINRLVEDAKLMEEAMALARNLADGPTLALALTHAQTASRHALTAPKRV